VILLLRLGIDKRNWSKALQRVSGQDIKEVEKITHITSTLKVLAVGFNPVQTEGVQKGR